MNRIQDNIKCKLDQTWDYPPSNLAIQFQFPLKPWNKISSIRFDNKIYETPLEDLLRQKIILNYAITSFFMQTYEEIILW